MPSMTSNASSKPRCPEGQELPLAPRRDPPEPSSRRSASPSRPSSAALGLSPKNPKKPPKIASQDPPTYSRAHVRQQLTDIGTESGIRLRRCNRLIRNCPHDHVTTRLTAGIRLKTNRSKIDPVRSRIVAKIQQRLRREDYVALVGHAIREVGKVERVVGSEDNDRTTVRSSGKITVTVVPASSSLLSSTWPPCCSTISLTNGSPNPAP